VHHERIEVTRRERSHAHGFRVALVLEENSKVCVDDLALNHWRTHAKSEPSKHQDVKSHLFGFATDKPGKSRKQTCSKLK